MPPPRLPLLTAVLVALLALAAVSGAQAADPGRWTLAGADRVPTRYYQGLTHDAAGAVFFTGVQRGAYRTDARLTQTLGLDEAIPPSLRAREGFDHIGDPSWDPTGGGRLLAPLECYRIGAPNGGNTCGRGAIGVLSRNLAWRYRVALDPQDIAKAMWAEVSPDGSLVWTSSGSDLLAYRTADLTPDAGAISAAPLRPVRRVAGAVPPSGVTGAAFQGGRLFLAGQDTGTFQVWSVDVGGGALDPRLEIERDIVGESEGLDVFTGRGGVLHWLVTPLTLSTRAPTFGTGANALLSFVPAGDGALTLRVTKRTLRAGRPATLAATVRQTLGGVTRPLGGVTVSAGSRRARTDEHGEAELRVRPLRAGRLEVRASRGDLAAPPALLSVAPSIGPPLPGPPSARVGVGAGGRRLRAARLIDCSGDGGCEAGEPPVRPRGCLNARRRADVRIVLMRRPARTVSVLIEDRAGRTVDAGRAAATGRNGLGWRFPVRGAIPARGRLTLVVVYPDLTGALTVTRLRADRRC